MADFDTNYFLQEDLLNFFDANDFSVLQQNARSLRTNFEELKLLLDDCRKSFDVICVTESWISEQDFRTSSTYRLEGYKSVYMERKKITVEEGYACMWKII